MQEKLQNNNSMRHLSGAEIEQAKEKTIYTDATYHEHPDCIRVAYQWLDAQRKTKRRIRKATYPIKHLIEKWAGRYISQVDVEVAATMHPEIKGEYPYYCISSILTEPDVSRLEDIPEAFTQDYRSWHNSESYGRSEGVGRNMSDGSVKNDV